MPCAGRCDEPVPVIDGDNVLVGTSADALESRATPLPPANPEHLEECVFAHIRERGRATIDGYRKTGGYEGLTAHLVMDWGLGGGRFRGAIFPGEMPPLP